MAQNQGQNALADTPKADDNEAPMESEVLHVEYGNQVLTGPTKPVRSEHGLVKLRPANLRRSPEAEPCPAGELHQRAARLLCSRLYGGEHDICSDWRLRSSLV